MNFKDLKLNEVILANLESAGYETPSEIQQKAIPVILDGKDVVGQSQTGTGKTASFALPLLNMTIAGMGIQHVILCPSRELAKQINDEFNKFSKGTGIRIVNIIGGVSYDIQRRDIKRNPDIIIATPGRIIDHLESRRIDIDLSNVKSLVLDEADEMLNFGFHKDILKFNEFLPSEKQAVFFTATFSKRTRQLADELLNNPVNVSVSSGLTTNDRVDQKFVMLKEKQKFVTLYNILQLENHKSAIIFGRTRRRVDELRDSLQRMGIKAAGIQGDMKQSERARAIKNFREGKITVIIGTDVLARGIDVDTIDLVINFDLPTEIEYYTHRIGRTGRAGRKGKAISFVKPSEDFYFNQIMQKTSSKAEEMKRPTDEDMIDHRSQQLDADLSHLLHLGREKYRSIAEKIEAEYRPEHISMMLAAAIIKDGANPYDVSLTGEPGVDGPQKRRRGNRGGRNRNRGGNRGGDRNRNGGNRGGNRGGDRNRSGGDRRSRGGNRGNGGNRSGGDRNRSRAPKKD